MAVVEVSNGARIGSIHSAMLRTIFIQMGISLVTGIIIHVLAATLIVDTLPWGIWFLEACMYLSAVSAPIWIWKLNATKSSQLSQHTDRELILQSNSSNDTLKTLVLRCFRRYNYSCCGSPALMTFLAPLTEVPNAISANRPDLLKWLIFFALVAFIPLLAFFIYNLIVLGKYEYMMKKNSLQESGICRGMLTAGEVGTVKFEALPGTLNRTVPTPDETLDTILRNR